MPYLTTAITILVVSIVLRYLLLSGKREPDRQRDGTLVFKYPGFVAVIGYIAIGFGVLIGIVTVFQIIPTTGDEVVPYLVLLFVLLGLPLVVIEKGIRITATDQMVRYVGPTKKAREIRWDEVRKVTFSFTSELVLHSELTRIKLNTMLVGFESFVEAMKKKLDPALYEKALQGYETTLKNMERRWTRPKTKKPS